MTTTTQKPDRPPRPSALWSYEGAVLGALLTARQLPWLDAPARALGVRPLTLDGLTELLAGHLHRVHAGHPLRLPTPLGSYLVPVSGPDAAELLRAAGAAGALGPGEGLDHAGRPRGQLACAAPSRPVRALGRTAAAVAAQETERLLAERDAEDLITRQDWTDAAQRIARRVVVGDAAAEDTVLSRVLAAAVAATGTRREAEWADALRRRLDPYLPGTVRGGPDGPPESAPALEHALAVVTEALCHTVPAALALAALGTEGAEEAVRTALDHWPPIAASTYRTTAPFDWQGTGIPAGSRLLCASAVLNALARQQPGRTAPSGPPSPLCSSPTPCPATATAVTVAEAVVGAVLAAARPVLLSPALDRDRLPATLDPTVLRLAFHDPDPVDGVADPVRAREVRHRPGSSRVVAPQGEPTVHYVQLAAAGAARLARHAEGLTACAEDARWTGPVGERFRTALLGHARRCAVTAADLRHAADRLGRAAGGPDRT
ncbi:hypothetical protein OHV05_02800 [Kitasatospora sp. NBC_00070]|uniref:hypothetical protein n=1 Tax=Kitasatospora sp. NBC_00070 TaxID=2975962 RepID=UPI00324D3175